MDVAYTTPQDKKKDVLEPKKVELKPKVENQIDAHQKQDAGVEGIRDDSLAGKSIKKTLKKG